MLKVKNLQIIIWSSQKIHTYIHNKCETNKNVKILDVSEKKK